MTLDGIQIKEQLIFHLIMPLKKSLSGLDISVIVAELHAIVGSWIDNIYEIETDDNVIYLMKLRNPANMLLIEPSKRIHLTEYKRSLPEKPSDKIMNLRRLVRDGKIASIVQHGLDRIIVIEIEAAGRNFQLICEFFAKGNIILTEKVTNENNITIPRIIFALWYKVLRERALLAGKEYEFPSTRGEPLKNLCESKIEELISLNSTNNLDIVKHLIKKYDIGGDIAEEILYRSQIPKTMLTQQLDKNHWETIIKHAQEFLAIELKPVIIYNDQDPIAVSAFDPQMIAGERKVYTSLNKAVDDYFHHYEDQLMPTDHSAKIKQLETIINTQKSHITNLQESIKQKKLFGELIYQYFSEIEELFKTIQTARHKNVPWEDILLKLTEAKAKRIRAAQIYDNIDLKKSTLDLHLGDQVLTVDFTQKVSDIANEYYQRAKKEEAKIEPAQAMINETEVKLEKIKQQQLAIVEKSKKILKQRKKYWYETYHWSLTINGFLAVAGRDLKTNEILARKKMGPKDLFFHADIHGAPYTILFIDDSKGEPQDADKQQAARLAACYSSVWKSGFHSADVYQVNADQVSFSAPSGESLTKGSIMVRGQRNFLKNIPLQLWVGVVIEEFSAYVIAGDDQFVTTKAAIWKKLIPGDNKKSDIAKHLKKAFTVAQNGDDQAKIDAIDLNEFVSVIPGSSEISNN